MYDFKVTKVMYVISERDLSNISFLILDFQTCLVYNVVCVLFFIHMNKVCRIKQKI